MSALRKYPDELRQRAIRLVRDADADPGTSRKTACRRVGQQLGISPETLRGWVNRDEIDTGDRPGVPTDVAADWPSWRKRTVSCGGRMRS